MPAHPISVTEPDGSSWAVGKATVSGASVTAPVTATGPAGPYTLSRAVHADGGGLADENGGAGHDRRDGSGRCRPCSNRGTIDVASIRIWLRDPVP